LNGRIVLSGLDVLPVFLFFFFGLAFFATEFDAGGDFAYGSADSAFAFGSHGPHKFHQQEERLR
jgi:hypothetical protein